jgi:hypothetical protein
LLDERKQSPNITVIDLIERVRRASVAVALAWAGRLARATAAPDYYRFLVVLCRIGDACQILEGGTDYGTFCEGITNASRWGAKGLGAGTRQ